MTRSIPMLFIVSCLSLACASDPADPAAGAPPDASASDTTPDNGTTPAPESDPDALPIEDEAEVAASSEAAGAALTELRTEMAGDPDFADNADISATETVGFGLTRLSVRLDELYAWEQGTAFGTLFHPVGIRMFFLLDGDQVTSAVVMRKDDDGEWRVVIEDPDGREVSARACRDEVEARTYASTVRQHVEWLSEEQFERYYAIEGEA